MHVWGGLPLDVCVSFVLPNVAIHNVQLAKNGLPRGVAWRRDGAESEAANLVERSECGACAERVGAKAGGQRGESEESEKGERSKGRWAKERPKGNPMDRSEASEVYRYERSVCDIPEERSTALSLSVPAKGKRDLPNLENSFTFEKMDDTSAMSIPTASPVLKRQLTAEARASLIQMLMFDTHAGYEKMGHAVPSARALTAEAKAASSSSAAAAAAAAADATIPGGAGGGATAAVSPSPRPPPYTGPWVVSEKIHGANVRT